MFKLVIWVCQEVAKVAVEIKALIHMGSTLAHTAKAVDWVWQVGQVAGARADGRAVKRPCNGSEVTLK